MALNERPSWRSSSGPVFVVDARGEVAAGQAGRGVDEALQRAPDAGEQERDQRDRAGQRQAAGGGDRRQRLARVVAGGVVGLAEALVLAARERGDRRAGGQRGARGGVAAAQARLGGAGLRRRACTLCGSSAARRRVSVSDWW